MQVKICAMIPMEDGVRLATDVLRPNGPGPFPAILIRTCYHRRQFTENIPASNAGRFLEAGYAVIVQDVRGKFDSEGTFRPLEDEARDGQATLDWIANESWCNGSVGLWGRSYLGIVQVPAASGGHPVLKAVAPSIAPGSYFRDWVRYDGCFGLYNMVRWPLQHASCRTLAPTGHFRYEDTWRVRSVRELEELTGIRAPFLEQAAAHDRDDGFWTALDQSSMYGRVRVPGYHVGGWFDHISRGQCEAFRRITAHGATDLARKEQRLLLGPYSHITLGGGAEKQRRLGDWDFGDEAVFDVFAMELLMFDHYLRHVDNGFDREPKVKVFLLGANRWVSFSDWPPRESRTERWYLCGDRRLSRDVPTTDSTEECVFDPDEPVPTLGGQVYWGHADQLGNCLGPVDQRKLLERRDVLHYRGDPLEQPLTIAGEPALEVTLTSDVEDADVIAKLCVEQPGGEIICLSLGQLRCRYRESFAQPQPLVPGEPTPVRVRFYPIAYRFPAGSRVGLILTYSDFPRINPNPGTMDPPLSGTEPCRARNAILHGHTSRSRLVLPVVETE